MLRIVFMVLDTALKAFAFVVSCFCLWLLYLIFGSKTPEQIQDEELLARLSDAERERLRREITGDRGR